MLREKLRVGVIGAGRWCQRAHLPGYVGSPLCDIVAIADLHEDLAKDAASKFSIPDVVYRLPEVDAAGRYRCDRCGYPCRGPA